MVWRDGYRQVILELDSTTAISLIQRGSTYPYLLVVARVQELLHRNWQVLIVCIFQEANRAADALATAGHSLSSGVCYYISCPPWLGLILHDDLAGVSFSRLVT